MEVTINIVAKRKKKQQTNYWKWGLIIIIFIIVFFIYWLFVVISGNPSSNDQIDSTWKQHKNILENDAIQTDKIISQYCYNNLPYEDLPACVNNIAPRLEAYANHLINAQEFILNYGKIYSNQQELLAWLDEQSIIIQTYANNIDVIIKEYNNWILNQQQIQKDYQQQQEILADILRILTMAI
jgi:hypothetical protein